jgi:hypothetical protein
MASRQVLTVCNTTYMCHMHASLILIYSRRAWGCISHPAYG